jgi:WD40 repeat protein
VHSLCLHPSGKYLVSVGTDGWHFLDIAKEGAFLQGTRTTRFGSDPASAYSCGAFHPDGLILGTGSASGALRIWDVRTLENPHVLPGHGAAMTCLSFSENGYQAASGGVDGSVRLWDLRKLTYTQSIEGRVMLLCCYCPVCALNLSPLRAFTNRYGSGACGRCGLRSQRRLPGCGRHRSER